MPQKSGGHFSIYLEKGGLFGTQLEKRGVIQYKMVLLSIGFTIPTKPQILTPAPTQILIPNPCSILIVTLINGTPVNAYL